MSSVNTNTGLMSPAGPEAAATKSVMHESTHSSKDSPRTSVEDVLGSDEQDPVLKAKMHLVNNAIDEIGWTNYHWKLFALNGFGYAVDSMLTLIQSIAAASAFQEFGQIGYSAGLNVASYAGLLIGALFWGFSADVIGRKIAFNVSLFICCLATLAAAGMPNWPSLAFFVALIGFGGGGNLILDTAVFLEYLPSSKQWALTGLAAWWGVGQAIAGFIAWGFMPPDEFNCHKVGCPRSENMGWRYVFITGGAIVLVASILRWTVIELKETPKYLLGIGKDAEVVETLQYVATKYGRSCSLTVEQLDACGVVQAAQKKPTFSIGDLVAHVRGLFVTRQLAWSTSLIWLSWTLIGLAYPLFYVFISTYLANRVSPGESTPFITWRNYTLGNISGIPGPIVAALMCNTRLGRKYTMVIGALVTMVFFFANTTAHTAAQTLAFNCLIAFCVNIYYGTLYAYTAEVMPSAHRGTGNGIAVSFNRLMGILSSVIATSGDTSSPAPIYVCGALFAAMAVVSIALPFEPYGRRSS